MAAAAAGDKPCQPLSDKGVAVSARAFTNQGSRIKPGAMPTGGVRELRAIEGGACNGDAPTAMDDIAKPCDAPSNKRLGDMGDAPTT